MRVTASPWQSILRAAQEACDVLTTPPYPIQRVLKRRGRGRFRVVQKAKLDNPVDVDRIENARAADWIMLGTHDTPTIWELAERWDTGLEGECRGNYFSELLTEEPNRPALSTRIACFEREAHLPSGMPPCE